MTTNRISIAAAIPTVLVLAALVFGRTTSAYGTSSPQVYNVVDYGADPTGVNDSSGAVNQAIFAAISGGQPLGVIYFPAGKFKIGGSIPASPLTGKAVNMHQLMFMGSGVNATMISVASGGSITLTSPVTLPYHGGSLRDFTISCANSGLTGVTTQDAVGIKWSNVGIENCSTGVDMQNVNAWTERNDFDDVTFFDCAVAVHLDRQPPQSNTKTLSYGYNDFRIWVNVDNPGTVFLMSGGGDAYNSTYSVQGNLAVGSIIFDAHNDQYSNVYANAMYNDTFFVKVEDTGTSGTSYVFDVHNAGGVNGEIHGTGQFATGPNTQWVAPNSNTVAVNNLLAAATDLGSFSIGSGSYDVYSNIFITPNSRCFVQPNNSAAAYLSGVYISGISWSQAVLYHPTSHAGASFEVWCHP
jgi:hypothetical protein